MVSISVGKAVVQYLQYFLKIIIELILELVFPSVNFRHSRLDRTESSPSLPRSLEDLVQDVHEYVAVGPLVQHLHTQHSHILE
jgi:hypothetical protein